MVSGIKDVDWGYTGSVSIYDGRQLYQLITPYSLEPNDLKWTPNFINYAPMWMTQKPDPTIDFNLPANGAMLRVIESLDKYEPYYQNKIQTVPALKFTTDESETLSTLRVTLENYISQMQVAFIAGERNLVSDWDAYVRALDSMGMPQLISIYQRAWDRIR